MPDIADVDPKVNTTQDLFGGRPCDPWEDFRGSAARQPSPYIDPAVSRLRLLSPDYEPYEPTLLRSYNPPRIVEGSIVWGVVLQAHAKKGDALFVAQEQRLAYKILIQPFAYAPGWRPKKIDMRTYDDPAKDYTMSLDFGRYRDEADPCDDNYYDFGLYTQELEEP